MAQESNVFQFSGVAKDTTLFVRVARAHASNVSSDRPLAYGVVFLRLGGGLGCFSPAIDNYIDKRHCVWPHKRLLHPRLYLEQLAMAA